MTDDRIDTPVPEEMAFRQAETLATLPFMVAAAWWDMACAAWLPPRTPPVEPGAQDGHSLHVPDPVEDDGERCLFA